MCEIVRCAILSSFEIASSMRPHFSVYCLDKVYVNRCLMYNSKFNLDYLRKVRIGIRSLDVGFLKLCARAMHL
jgi:hypothetical protein